MLTRDAILSTPLPPPATLDVPEWGGQVALRTLSLPEMLAFAAEQDAARRAVVMVRLCVAHHEGAPLFAAEDDPWLAGLPWALLQRLAQACMAHNGLTGEAQERAAGN